jgi:hypothetical protein
MDNNISTKLINVKETACDGMDYIQMAKDRD